MAPFPLQDREGRLQALQTLYEEAGEHKLASEITALRGLQVIHPEMGADELQSQPRHSQYPARAPRRGSMADASGRRVSSRVVRGLP